MEEKISNLMKILKCSREEAIDIIETDKAIDRGERTKYDLDVAKEKQIIKEFVNTKSRVSNKTDNNRGKAKPKNETKIAMVAELAEWLKTKYDNVSITNENREISFSYNGNNFAITLVQKKS